MGWTPEEFWRATFYELSCGYIGHCRANGLGRWAVDAHGWSEDSLEDHRKIVADLKAKFPDQPRKRRKRGDGHV